MNENKIVKHIKTGNWGFFIDEYKRTTDGKKMITVKTISGIKAYWDASKVELRDNL